MGAFLFIIICMKKIEVPCDETDPRSVAGALAIKDLNRELRKSHKILNTYDVPNNAEDVVEIKVRTTPCRTFKSELL